jgi:plastocyanin
VIHAILGRRVLSLLVASVFVVAAGAGGAVQAAQDEPTGLFLDPEELQEITAQFGDEVLTGGQTAPRISRWVNEDVFVFLQLDNPDVAEATAINYIGISVKGVFCAETQPDPSFTHFHKYEGAEYSESHGSAPGDQGYWLTWAATDSFEARDGRQIEPGIDYEFSPTPPPDCGDQIPEVSFDPPEADALTSEEIVEFMGIFDDGILTGGQTPPRYHKWINEAVTIFFQFDSPDPAEATALLNVGITVPGTFCLETQPSEDFPHFHQTHGPTYGESHGSAPDQEGYWLLWIATASYEARDGRLVEPGVDRAFSPTPPPTCGEGESATPEASGGMTVTGSEFRFEPAELRVSAGSHVMLTLSNVGAIPHTLTIPAVDADTGSVAAGESVTLAFTAPAAAGSYEFLCTFGGHLEEGMVGTLIVE